jgi:hypothetical protein
VNHHVKLTKLEWEPRYTASKGLYGGALKSLSLAIGSLGLEDPSALSAKDMVFKRLLYGSICCTRLHVAASRTSKRMICFSGMLCLSKLLDDCGTHEYHNNLK